MDTVRNGFLGELYGTSCCACDIRYAFICGKTKGKVYITADPESSACSHSKNLIIDESHYGIKTSVTRFHQHLSASLLRLGFKKTKYDPVLFMLDKTSHYEYLDTYMDDILVWSKDPMTVKKSLEKTYNLKSECIAEYYLDGNLEFLGETWKNQRLGLALSGMTCIKNVIPKFNDRLERTLSHQGTQKLRISS
jgi:hypothetical protein